MRPPVVSSLPLLLFFGVGRTLASPVTLSTPTEVFGSIPAATADAFEGRVERAIGEQLPEGGKKKLKEQEIIQRILKDYDWRVRPIGNNESWPDTGGPVMVVVNIYLRSISKIDDVNMEYSAQFTFREQWTDKRLAYMRFADDQTLIPPFVVLATSEQGTDQQIWMPDTFFQNEKEARRHMIDKPNVLIRIYPDGAILYSVRLTLTLSCPMFLHFYPLDRQECLIDLASYAYTTEDIKYEWKSENPIQQKDGLRQSLPSFELQDVLTEYCTSKTNTGEYSCARVKLMLRREYSYYLIQLYIPSFMLVVVSWVSFWLDKDAVPARVSLGVTTLLTMTTQASGINAKLPPVSYTKAVDVWIGVCLAFIFGALLEFALVNYYGRMEFLKKEKKAKKFKDQNVNMLNPGLIAAPFAVDPPRKSLSPQPSASPFVPADPQLDVGCPQCNDEAEQLHWKQQVNEPEVRLFGVLQHQASLLNRPLMPIPLDLSMHPKRQRRMCCPFARKWLKKYNERSKRIDILSRVIFPMGFIFFNCFYWTYYFSKDQ